MFEMKESPKYCKSLGNYNNLPEPCVECDIGEFWHHYFTYTSEVEFRRCKAPWIEYTGVEFPPVHLCIIHWFPSVAFVLFELDKWSHKGRVNKLHYVDQPRCYRIWL